MKGSVIKLGLLAAVTAATQTSIAASLGPSTMTLSKGTVSGTATNLAVANEGQVVNLYSNRRGKLNADFKFNLPTGKSYDSLITRVRIDNGANTYVVRRLTSSGTWVKVGEITGSGGSFQDLKMNIDPKQISGAELSLRIVALDSADDLTLDSLVLNEVQSATTTDTAPVGQDPVVVQDPVIEDPIVVDPVPSDPVVSLSPLLPGTTWYWQLQGTIKTTVNAQVYDIDLFDNSATLFSSLKTSGKFVVCYFSAGTYEGWRSDAGRFPASALGSTLDGWPDERWIDVRNSTVRQIMVDRLALAKSKGCDSVEPDNVDGYSNRNGLGLTMQDQIDYLKFLADAAHSKGLLIALKNSTDLVTSLVDKFDFAVVEECFRYNECEMYSPFIRQGKAVLNAEYSSPSSAICTKAKSLQFSTVFFNLALDGKVYSPCP